MERENQPPQLFSRCHTRPEMCRSPPVLQVPQSPQSEKFNVKSCFQAPVAFQQFTGMFSGMGGQKGPIEPFIRHAKQKSCLTMIAFLKAQVEDGPAGTTQGKDNGNGKEALRAGSHSASLHPLGSLFRYQWRTDSSQEA